MRRHQGGDLSMRCQGGGRGLIHPGRARQHKPATQVGMRNRKPQRYRRSHRNAADDWWRATKRFQKERGIFGKPAD